MASKISLQSVSIEHLLTSIRFFVLHENYLQDRRIKYCMNFNYNQFRRHQNNHKIALRPCIEKLIDFQKDFPMHLLASVNLLHRLRYLFHKEPWCKARFHQTDLRDVSSSFGQKLISASANAYLSTSSTLDSTKSYHSSILEYPCTQTLTEVNDLVAFFSKTPSPARHKFPSRFCLQRFNNSNYRRSHMSHWCTNKYWPKPLFQTTSTGTPLEDTISSASFCLQVPKSPT